MLEYAMIPCADVNRMRSRIMSHRGDILYIGIRSVIMFVFRAERLVAALLASPLGSKSEGATEGQSGS
jgi:hypothetical protein